MAGMSVCGQLIFVREFLRADDDSLLARATFNLADAGDDPIGRRRW
jgi:hypothetical protein